MPNPLESPIPVLLLGLLLGAVFGILLLRTGRGLYLVALGGVAVLVLLGVVIERLVVTENERVADALDEARAAVQANDLPRLLNSIAPGAAEARNLAQSALGRGTFSEVKIRDLKVKVNQLTSPPSAKARFSASVSFHDRKGEVPYEYYATELEVELQKAGGRWLIAGVRDLRQK